MHRRNKKRNILKYTILIAIFIIIAIYIFSCISKNDSTQNETTESTSPTWGKLSTYLDSESIYKNGNFLNYNKNGAYAKQGIDISDSQGYINWDAVRTNNLDFAFIRLGYRGTTEGGIHNDKKYLYNIENAQNIKLDTNAYFYTQAVTETEAKEDAQFAIKLARQANLQAGKYIAFDYEISPKFRTYNVDKDTILKILDVFMNEINNSEYKAMIYGDYSHLTVFGEENCKKYPIWLAQYDTINPKSPCKFNIWQYSNKGTISGISTNVDLCLWIDDIS